MSGAIFLFLLCAFLAMTGTTSRLFIMFSAAALLIGGTRWRSRLRHYATIQKVAVSIPDGVIGIFR